MLYDINKIQKHDAVITLYADDLAICKESKCIRFTNITKTNSFLRQIQKQFHEIINTVKQYMFHKGFSLSSKKAVFIIFGLWHPVSPEFRIIINDQRLYAAKQSNIWVLPSSGQVASPNMFIVISSRPFGPLT